MMISAHAFLSNVFSDASPLSFALSLLGGAGALFAAHCGCGHCHGHDHDDHDDEFSDEEADFSFSREELLKFQQMLEELNERIEELSSALESGEGDRKEVLGELAALLLQRAALAQEQEDVESAAEDYARAFPLLEAHVEEFGETLEVLKHLAGGRLNNAIMLNDAGALAESCDEYELALALYERLAELGETDAPLDVNGVKLNIAFARATLGDLAGSEELFDEACEGFQTLVAGPMSQNPEARYYLARALAARASFLVEKDDDSDPNPLEAEQAKQLLDRAIEEYRILVNSGNTQYIPDLADELTTQARRLSGGSREDLGRACELLSEAGSLYEKVIALGDTSAVSELFDVSLERAEILEELDLAEDAANLYGSLIDAFSPLEDGDDIVMLEGLAQAYVNRAGLLVESRGTDEYMADVAKALKLQLRVADDVIATLAESRDGDEGCGHDCGGCGGHDGEEDGCGCGCCGGEHARKFMIERWATDNISAIADACFALAQTSADLGKKDLALEYVKTFEETKARYAAVLRPDEELVAESEPLVASFKLGLF